MNLRLLLFSTVLFLSASSAFAQPTTMWSASANTTWYNSQGTEFLISTPEQFAGLSMLVAGGNDFTGKTINLENDLDLSANLWTPIGVSFTIAFSGTFNGNGHTISGLFVLTPGELFAGLFGLCKNSTVNNIRLVGPYIRAEGDAGALAGSFGTDSNMADCHATGVDIITTSSNTGGLVGTLIDNATMLRCSSEGSVTGVNQIGGLVGSPYDLTNISECWSAGTVSAQYLAGGLVGYSTFAFGPGRENTLNNCYSRADVTVVNGRAGGLYGGADGNLIASNCYSTGTASGPEFIGGLIGAAGGMNIANSYWDTESSALADGIGGWLGPQTMQVIIAKTTAEMKTTAMVALLNAGQTPAPWTIDPSINDGYPRLASMTVGLPEVEGQAFDLSVYPTLVDANVRIETEAGLTNYSIFTTAGKLVRTGELTGNTAMLNLRWLASGTYVLAVKTDKGTATRRIVKQ